MLTYKLFTRKGCPNCPPVRTFVEMSDFGGVLVDCGTEEGLEEARRYGVQSTPTVIFFDEEGCEKSRAHTTREVERIENEVD